MRRLVWILAFTLSACGTGGLSLKQQAVIGLQTSETALETAHDMERNLCFTNAAIETGSHCTSSVAAKVGLSDAMHTEFARLFEAAFKDQIQVAQILQSWRSGDPAPTTVADYQKDVNDILNLARQLLNNGGVRDAAAFIDKVQIAVNDAAKVATAVGVK